MAEQKAHTNTTAVPRTYKLKGVNYTNGYRDTLGHPPWIPVTVIDGAIYAVIGLGDARLDPYMPAPLERDADPDNGFIADVYDFDRILAAAKNLI